MTRFKYYSNYLACLLGTLITFELCWIGAKYVIEGEVVHTCLDHFIAVCGSFYITRDTMKIWLKLQTKSYWFILAEKTAEEKQKELATAALATNANSITDLQLALAEVYEMIIGGK